MRLETITEKAQRCCLKLDTRHIKVRPFLRLEIGNSEVFLAKSHCSRIETGNLATCRKKIRIGKIRAWLERGDKLPTVRKCSRNDFYQYHDKAQKEEENILYDQAP